MHKDFFTITVGEKQYELRPNFRVAVGIESRTGKTLAQAVFSAKSLTVGVLHSILCAALVGNGHTVSDDDVGEALMKDYATSEMPLIKGVLEFVDGFFPQVENEGTKKLKAKNQKAG